MLVSCVIIKSLLLTISTYEHIQVNGIYCFPVGHIWYAIDTRPLYNHIIIFWKVWPARLVVAVVCLWGRGGGEGKGIDKVNIKS